MSKNKDMTEKIRLLCKSVGPAKQTMTVARKDIDALNQKLSQATTERMKTMLQGAIEKRECEIEKAESIVCSFMNIVDGLEREERNVMMQIYLRRRKRRDVEALDGVPMSMQEVDTIRKRALRHMLVNSKTEAQLMEIDMSENV